MKMGHFAFGDRASLRTRPTHLVILVYHCLTFIKSYKVVKNDEAVPKMPLVNYSQPQGIKLNYMNLEIEKSLTLTEGVLK